MTTKAHTVRTVYHGGTKQPTGYVRTVQEKRPPVGWLDVSANEFAHLLAQHEAGDINLLSMPECTGDTVELPDDEPEENTAETINNIRRFGPVYRDMGSAVRVCNLLSQSRAALTAQDIAQRTSLTTGAVRTILRRNPQWFVCVSIDGHVKRWKKI